MNKRQEYTRDTDRNPKLLLLERSIAERGSLLVMYSGGVDSTFLAWVAHHILGKKTHCVLLDSPLIPRREVQEAMQRSQRYGLSCRVIKYPILALEEFRVHPPHRCYLCRKHSIKLIQNEAQRVGATWIADGLTTSDLNQHRPGMIALEEAGIIHPLVEAGISKDEVRNMARTLGLDMWNKPSAACLASRIPYGTPIDEDILGIIEKAEDTLLEAGFSQIRARLHGPVMRIEVPAEELHKVLEKRESLLLRLKNIRCTYITFDLEGFRSGSMDEGR